MVYLFLYTSQLVICLYFRDIDIRVFKDNPLHDFSNRKFHKLCEHVAICVYIWHAAAVTINREDILVRRMASRSLHWIIWETPVPTGHT